MPKLLIIDDEPGILRAFQRVFQHTKVTLLTANTAAEGLHIVSHQQPDVVILDIQLPDLSGLEAFQRIHDRDPRIPVIFITGHGTTDTAIEAMKVGAYEYMIKPLDLDRLRDLVNRAFAISRLMHGPSSADVAYILSDKLPTESLVGSCAAMQEVYKAIGRVAPQDVTVLILGESGTGKELVARAIYHHSRRASGPFLAINSAALAETLLESELFGHEKGAFTGADKRRCGKFEQCTGGTLFLDEIGDMPMLTQSKILRVLQEQCFERVGGNETIRTDVRLIAATNRNLEQLVDQGLFRRDLYYRLSVFTIQLPPLRERKEDLPQLAEHFVRRFSRELSKEIHSIHPDTMDILQHYSWPGNLRELQSVLKQALLQATGPVLVPEFLPALVRKNNGVVHETIVERGSHTSQAALDWEMFLNERLEAGTRDLYAEARRVLERDLLTRVLQYTHGNQLQAARMLGISRGNLRTKLRALGITIERSFGEVDSAMME
ncbi:MAG: sigma-54-dependent transcriptional regulator [Gemmataceae bacterium]